MRSRRHKREPHVVRLPKGSISPTGSIYKEFDIVSQGRVLNTYPDSKYVIRSLEPFTLRYSLKGKIREVHSKHELAL